MDEIISDFYKLCNNLETEITLFDNDIKTYDLKNFSELIKTKKFLVETLVSYLEKIKNSIEKIDITTKNLKNLISFLNVQLNFLIKFRTKNSKTGVDINILVNTLNVELQILTSNLNFIIEKSKKPFFPRVLNYLLTHKLKNGNLINLDNLIMKIIENLKKLNFKRKLSKDELFILRVILSKVTDTVDIPVISSAINSMYKLNHLTSDLTIRGLISRYEQDLNVINANLRKSDWGSVTIEPVIVVEDETYALYKLITAKQLSDEGDRLNHCVGDSNNLHGEKVRSNELEVFSYRNKKTNKSILTIGYIRKVKTLNQIRKLDDEFLTGSESYFNSFISLLAKLEKSKSDSGKLREIVDFRDLNNLNLQDSVLTYSGVTKISSFDFKTKIIHGCINFSQDMGYDYFLKLSKLKNMNLDLTNIDNNFKNNLKFIEGTIIDRNGNSCYDSLVEVCGSFNLGVVTSISFPNLKFVRGSFNLASAEIVSLPKLTHVEGYISLYSVKLVSLPMLNYVGGDIFLNSANSLNLPSLKSVMKIFLDKSKIKTLNLPSSISPKIKYV